MAAKIVEEEEKRMFFEMNEQQRLKANQRCAAGGVGGHCPSCLPSQSY